MSIGKVLSNAVRCHIAAWDKSNIQVAGKLQEIRFGMARAEAQFNYLLSTSASALNRATTVKRILRDQWISWPRQMFLLQILLLDTWRERPVLHLRDPRIAVRGPIHSLVDVRFFHRRSSRASCSRVAVSIPKARASFVRNCS